MNNFGKERMALEMANTAASILLNQEEVISLGWKDEQEISMGDGPNEDNISLREDPKETTSVQTNVQASSDDKVQDGSTDLIPRISKWKNRPPTTKSDNFLW